MASMHFGIPVARLAWMSLAFILLKTGSCTSADLEIANAISPSAAEVLNATAFAIVVRGPLPSVPVSIQALMPF